MPLSEELRNELAGIKPERDCDRLAELSGLAHTAGSLHIHGRGEIGLQLDLASPAAARRAFSLLRELELTDALRRVGRGETVTYGELAALAGRPNAQRAAGSFCARNRFSIVVPCHRVVAADGLGSYGSLGVDYKRRLLELEGAAV